MKPCPYCKNLIPSDSLYCPNCNKPLLSRIQGKSHSLMQKQDAFNDAQPSIGEYWEKDVMDFTIIENPEIDNRIQEIDTLIERKIELGESISELLLEKSALYYKKRDLDAAVKVLNLALDNYTQENNLLKIAIVFNELGIIHEEMGFFDQAILFFNNSADILKKLNEIEKIIQVYNNLGNIYFILEEIEKSHDYYSKALELARKHGFHSLEIKTSSNLIDVLFELKEHDKIKQILERNLYYFKSERDLFGIIHTHTKMGKLYYEWGKHYYDLALEELNTAEKLIEKINDAKSYRIIKAQLAWECYFLLGKIHSELNDFNAAEDFLFRSLEAVRILEIGEDIKESMILESLGNFYEKKKDFFKAIEYHELAAEISYKYGKDLQQANIIFHIGTLFFEILQDSSKAIEYYNKALEIYEKKNHLKKCAETLNILGDIYLDISADLAISYFEKAKSYYSELLDEFNVRLLTEKITSLMNLNDD
ncbi:MAG: tetratricopeptide repeat protein [Promethearchaeota archaeon]